MNDNQGVVSDSAWFGGARAMSVPAMPFTERLKMFPHQMENDRRTALVEASLCFADTAVSVLIDHAGRAYRTHASKHVHVTRQQFLQP